MKPQKQVVRREPSPILKVKSVKKEKCTLVFENKTCENFKIIHAYQNMNFWETLLFWVNYQRAKKI